MTILDTLTDIAQRVALIQWFKCRIQGAKQGHFTIACWLTFSVEKHFWLQAILEGGISSMKQLTYLFLPATLVLLAPLSAIAADKIQQHSVSISDPVTVGSAQLKTGNYKVEWQGTGPSVQVSFIRQGKTIATVPAALQTNAQQVTQDSVVMDHVGSNVRTLKELDFGHAKQALVFGEGGM